MLDEAALTNEIQAAFDAESDTNINPADARKRTAKAIAKAIIKCVKGATVTIDAGISVSTTGSATAQTGKTTTTGKGAIT